MTDNEIIKVFECCTKSRHFCNAECPFFENCDRTKMSMVALDLINRQKAEIDELREIIFTDRTEAIKKLKAEAVKEFAERLKKEMADKKYKYVTETNYSKTVNVVIDVCIVSTDNLVKEMTEQRKEDEGK